MKKKDMIIIGAVLVAGAIILLAVLNQPRSLSSFMNDSHTPIGVLEQRAMIRNLQTYGGYGGLVIGAVLLLAGLLKKNE